MRAILVEKFGKAENMNPGDCATPHPQEEEVLVKVKATALNRADILQRQGKYPPPHGASDLLGLEIAGEIVEVGKKVTQWKIGEKIFGLIPGGGYAEYAVIHQNMAMPLPSTLSLEEAVALPEVFLTAYQALVWLAKLQPKEHILIHAGASGVGTAAIQLAKVIGTKVIATASAAKHRVCYDLGAQQVIDYTTQNFAEEVYTYTQGKGVDVILDFIAADYFQQNIDTLAVDGRMIMLALLGGFKVQEVNLAKILTKRIQITGSTLRNRSLSYQIRLTQEWKKLAFPLIESQKIHPVIDRTFSWKEVIQAHHYMETNKNVGKIVLLID